MPKGIYKRTVCSIETRIKISNSLKGRPHSEERIKNIRLGRLATYKKGKDNPCWKEKINKICPNCKKEFFVIPARKETAKYCSFSCRQKHFWQSVVYKENYANKMKGKPSPMKGKHHSEETKIKIREWHINNPNKKSMDTSIELKLEFLLQSLGVEYKKQVSLFNIAIVDFYILNKKLVIQCDGCFYHGCPIHNPEYTKNKERDHQQDEILQQNGLKVIRFWEHEINSPNFSIRSFVD